MSTETIGLTHKAELAERKYWHATVKRLAEMITIYLENKICKDIQIPNDIPMQLKDPTTGQPLMTEDGKWTILVVNNDNTLFASSFGDIHPSFPEKGFDAVADDPALYGVHVEYERYDGDDKPKKRCIALFVILEANSVQHYLNPAAAAILWKLPHPGVFTPDKSSS